MGQIEQTVALPAPPERVWSVVSDPARFGDWLTMHRSWVGEPPTAIAQGDAVTAAIRVAEMPFTITWTVQEFTPPHVVQLHGRGPMGVEVTVAMTVEAGTGSDDSTAMISVLLEGALVTGPIGTVLERGALTELQASTAKLRELLR